MSNNSDSDEFFDAEDNQSPKARSNTDIIRVGEDKYESMTTCTSCNMLGTENQLDILGINMYNKQSELKKKRNSSTESKGRQRFKELRYRMQTEEEDGAISNTSPVDSQVSSIDDVFAGPSSKMLHPFRVIEHDTLSIQSMTSLGRVGRLLSGASDSGAHLLSGTSKDDVETEIKSVDSEMSSYAGISSEREYNTSNVEVHNTQRDTMHRVGLSNLQEPDVIASTKNSNSHNLPINAPVPEPVPIAPPRKKRKAKTTPLQQSNSGNSISHSSSSSTICKENIALYNTESTIETLTRELENSLDIRLAVKGHYVVRIQDEDAVRAERHHSFNEKRQKEQNGIEMISSLDNSRYPSKSVNATASMTRNSSTYPLSSVSGNSVSGMRAGLGLRLGVNSQANKERRKSTGDEQLIPHQLNMFVRTRTDSGKQLTDMEILEQVTVLNLDTGERVPLSIAEDKLPQCINPLSLHIMRLTSEYVSNSSLSKHAKESDEESISSKQSLARTIDDEDQDSIAVIKRTAKFKRFVGLTVRKTVSKAKTIAQEVSHVRHKDDIMEIKDEVNAQHTEPFKLRASNNHKGPYEFKALQYVQELGGEHAGPVWCMKFSSCGRLLATAGRDRILRIWVLRNAYTYFQEMRTKYNAEKVSPTPSQESLVSQQSSEDPSFISIEGYSDDNSPFMPKPFCTYMGHTSDLLDLAWSKNYFVLSSSMDKTVRLWHISRKECLCCFQHIDFVTAICFHPKDDRYFLSGSLDGKLRLWNIPDKKVAVWNEVDGVTKLITAANFCQNGKFAVVGSYDGRCIFYNTDQLRYHTQIHVRSTRGKNSQGRKITGIEPMPGEDKILVTSNDSRIRLYDLKDLNLSCKYKGYANVSSQIKASFSHDGKFIICGSENQCIYIWKTHHDYSKFPSVRRDRNDFWEGIKAHNAVVTCAVFAPNPDAIFQQIEESRKREKGTDSQNEEILISQHAQSSTGYVLVSADFNGCIRVFLNKVKPKHSSLPASALA